MRLRGLNRGLVCRQAVELISDYLEGALPKRDRERLEAHLRACDGCDEYLRQVQATIRILGNVKPTDLDPETRRGLMDVYRQFPGGMSPTRRGASARLGGRGHSKKFKTCLR